MSELMEYTDAIQTIKQAILDAQAAAIKSVNEKQLALITPSADMFLKIRAMVPGDPMPLALSVKV